MSAEQTRRTFLQRAGLGGIVLACTAVALPADLAALPVSYTDGTGSANEKSYPIPATDSVSIDRTVSIILVRLQGHAFAFRLSCPHQNAAVKWLDREGRFQCTKHDSKYQPDGTYTSGKSTRNLDRIAIRKDAANLVVDLNRVFQSDKDPNGWAGAVVSV